MTRAEVCEIMALIAEEHPKFLNTPAPERRLNLWAAAFEKVPREIVEFATVRALAEKPFEPKLSDIVERVKEMMKPENDNALNAWNMLAKAAARATVVTSEEFESLPYEVKRFCGGLSGLVDLGNIAADIFSTVTRGQFMKIYDNLRRQRETLELMPPEILALTKAVGKCEPPRIRSKSPERLPEPNYTPCAPVERAPKTETPSVMTAEEWNARRNELVAALDKMEKAT